MGTLFTKSQDFSFSPQISFEMPLVIVTGFPSSGKTSAVNNLVKFFEARDKAVCVVNEEALLGGLSKNVIFADSKHEKEVRGRLKSEVVRLLTKDNVVICDGLNYIKGFRYELYCASKSVKTNQVTVQCDVSQEDVTMWNSERPDIERYDGTRPLSSSSKTVLSRLRTS